jgi:hypothetical protein
MKGRQYTWANNRPVPTYEKLDRILMDAEWETKYPMVSVRAMERIEKLSDHAPLLLTLTLINCMGRNHHSNLNWGGFPVMVLRIWSRKYGIG